MVANRKEFLKTTTGAVVAPYVITSAALGNQDRPAPSERIVMGGIGIGNMGRGDMGACHNGKDVYCQKPETRTLREGRLMVEAARRYGRVVSGGSQRVLGDYRGVVDKCWSGELGTIKSINVNVSPLPRPCNLAGEPIPEGFDWDMWLGPAPWAPYHPYRCSGSFAINGTSWRSFSDYSGGGMTDWGAHHFGGATFAVDVRHLEPVEVTYNDENGRPFLTYRYPNGILLHHNHPGMGNLHVEGTPGEKRPPKPVPSYKGQGGRVSGEMICVTDIRATCADIFDVALPDLRSRFRWLELPQFLQAWAHRHSWRTPPRAGPL